MPSNWFRLPQVGTGTRDDPLRPKYSDQFDAFSGQILANSPRYIARVYAARPTLNSIRREPDAQELTDAEVENALNSLLGAGNTIETWENKFSVSVANPS